MKYSQMAVVALLLIGLLLPVGGRASEMQKELKINEVFQRYGKQKNVTMVELSNEMLETFNLTHYKSIVIKNNPAALSFVRQCLETDQQGAKKIKEVTDNGQLVSSYYQLPGTSTNLNRFILFKVNEKGDVTLVYIEGEIDSEDLITILFTK